MVTTENIAFRVIFLITLLFQIPYYFPDCPFNSIPYDGKCHGVYTFTTAETQAPYTADLIGFPAALSFCEKLSPAGNLILPESAAENEFIQKLAKLTE